MKLITPLNIIPSSNSTPGNISISIQLKIKSKKPINKIPILILYGLRTCMLDFQSSYLGSSFIGGKITSDDIEIDMDEHNQFRVYINKHVNYLCHNHSNPHAFNLFIYIKYAVNSPLIKCDVDELDSLLIHEKLIPSINKVWKDTLVCKQSGN